MQWRWPPFTSAFPVRLTMLLVFLGCTIAVLILAPWWGAIPLALLTAYQGLWVVMLLIRRGQGRLPTRGS